MKRLIIILFLFIISISFAQKQTIEQAEYFIGNDPGEGKGTPLQLANFGDATVNITWQDLPKLGMGQHVYVRVKSSGFMPSSGIYINGVWSLPMVVNYPTKAVLKGAEAKIIRPGLGYPLLKSAWATDGKFDNVIEGISTIISGDSLQAGDTLYIRLQGKDDLWGDWTLIPLRKEHLQLSQPLDLNAENIGTTSPIVKLTWTGNSDAASKIIIERKNTKSSINKNNSHILSDWEVIDSVDNKTTEYIDKDVIIGSEYEWQVKAVGLKSWMDSEYSNIASLLVTGINESKSKSNFYFYISQNPVNQIAEISYYLPKDTYVSIKLYDIIGYEISTFINDYQISGIHIIEFNFEDYPSGVYFCTLKAGKQIETIKMMVIK